MFMSLLLGLIAFGPSNDSYAITLTMQLAKPYDVRAMNDEFQSARLLSEKAGVGTFEIRLHPLHFQTVTGNPNWAKDDKDMAEFLKPRPAANWDAAFRKTLLHDLALAGIDPQKLDDRTLVERVSSWAMQRSTFNSQFGLWMVKFQDGVPVIPNTLRKAFRDNEPKGLSDSELFGREVFGKEMYANKTHGACTSTATYMTTLLRALGIPTRIILTVPAADANDRNQVETLLRSIRHNSTRLAIRRGMPLTSDMFTNHVFNEAWIGKKWVRLNYARLGQPIVDKNYLGLMVHVYTAKDFSDVPFAETWGARYAGKGGPKLSSVNPYRLIKAADHVGNAATFENPPIPTLSTQTVTSAAARGDTVPQGLSFPTSADFVLFVKEWLKEDDYHQMRDFLGDASRLATLHCAGKPDLKARVVGSCSLGGGQGQGYGFKVEGTPVRGVIYRISIDNSGFKHKWALPDTLSIIFPGRS